MLKIKTFVLKFDINFTVGRLSEKSSSLKTYPKTMGMYMWVYLN